ncbi:MAG: hypothetical protein RLZZ458_966, partial [Planctomycetota bacterium]
MTEGSQVRAFAGEGGCGIFRDGIHGFGRF